MLNFLTFVIGLLCQVTSATYVSSRVEEEIAMQRSELMDEEERIQNAEEDAAQLRKDLKAVDVKRKFVCLVVPNCRD